MKILRFMKISEFLNFINGQEEIGKDRHFHDKICFLKEKTPVLNHEDWPSSLSETTDFMEALEKDKHRLPEFMNLVEQHGNNFFTAADFISKVRDGASAPILVEFETTDKFEYEELVLPYNNKYVISEIQSDSYSNKTLKCTGYWIDFQKGFENGTNIDDKHRHEFKGEDQAREDVKIKIPLNYDKQEVFWGNSGKMYLVTDKSNGQEFLFKPAQTKSGETCQYRAYIQEAAYGVQQIINSHNAVRCNTVTLDGEFGAIQERIQIDEEATKAFREYFTDNKGELLPEMIDQILDEYLVDFCLYNYDCHSRNFLIDKNGNLRGIDKEQAFKFISEDGAKDDVTFSKNYNNRKNMGNPLAFNITLIYETIFKKMQTGEISYDHFARIKEKANALTQFPDEQYKKIFEQYALSATDTKEEAEALLNSILERKHNIMEYINQLDNMILNGLDKNNIQNTSPESNENEHERISWNQIGKRTVNSFTLDPEKTDNAIGVIENGIRTLEEKKVSETHGER